MTERELKDRILKIAKEDGYEGVLSPRSLDECAEVYAKFVDEDGVEKPRSWRAKNGKKSNLSRIQWLLVRTRSFRNWFGRSVVLDENGDPQVMYHGSAKEFDEFSPSAIGVEKSKMTLWSGPGFYFTDSKKVAGIYGKRGGVIMEFFLRLENPLVVDETGNAEKYADHVTQKEAVAVMLEGDNTQWLDSTICGELVRMTGKSRQTFKAMSRKERVEAYVKELKTDVVKLKCVSSAFGAKSQKKMMDAICKHTGRDGVIHKIAPGVTEWVVYDPKAIKSATDNDGDFSRSKACVEDAAYLGEENTDLKGRKSMFSGLIDSLNKLKESPAADHEVAQDIVDRHGRHHQPKAIPEGGQYEEESQYLHGQAKVDAAMRKMAHGKHAAILRDHVAPMYAAMGKDSITRAKIQAMHEDIRGLSKNALLRGMSRHLKDAKKHAQAYEEVKDMDKEQFKNWLNAHPEYAHDINTKLLNESRYNGRREIKGGFHDDGTGHQKHEAWEEAKWGVGAKAMASMILFQEHADALSGAPDQIMANAIEHAMREQEGEVENREPAQQQIVEAQPQPHVGAGHPPINGSDREIQDVFKSRIANALLGRASAAFGNSTGNGFELTYEGSILNQDQRRELDSSPEMRALSEYSRDHHEELKDADRNPDRYANSMLLNEWSRLNDAVLDKAKEIVGNDKVSGIVNEEAVGVLRSGLFDPDNDYVNDIARYVAGGDVELGDVTRRDMHALENLSDDTNEAIRQAREILSRYRREPQPQEQTPEPASEPALAQTPASATSTAASTYTDREGNSHEIVHNEGGLKGTIHQSEIGAVQAEMREAFNAARDGDANAAMYAHALSHFLGRGNDERSPHPGMRQEGLLKHQLADKMVTRLEAKQNALENARNGGDEEDVADATEDLEATRKACRTIADKCGITADMLPEDHALRAVIGGNASEGQPQAQVQTSTASAESNAATGAYTPTSQEIEAAAMAFTREVGPMMTDMSLSRHNINEALAGRGDPLVLQAISNSIPHSSRLFQEIARANGFEPDAYGEGPTPTPPTAPQPPRATNPQHQPLVDALHNLANPTPTEEPTQPTNGDLPDSGIERAQAMHQRDPISQTQIHDLATAYVEQLGREGTFANPYFIEREIERLAQGQNNDDNEAYLNQMANTLGNSHPVLNELRSRYGMPEAQPVEQSTVREEQITPSTTEPTNGTPVSQNQVREPDEGEINAAASRFQVAYGERGRAILDGALARARNRTTNPNDVLTAENMLGADHPVTQFIRSGVQGNQQESQTPTTRPTDAQLDEIVNHVVQNGNGNINADVVRRIINDAANGEMANEIESVGFSSLSNFLDSYPNWINGLGDLPAFQALRNHVRSLEQSQQSATTQEPTPEQHSQTQTTTQQTTQEPAAPAQPTGNASHLGEQVNADGTRIYSFGRNRQMDRGSRYEWPVRRGQTITREQITPELIDGIVSNLPTGRRGWGHRHTADLVYQALQNPSRAGYRARSVIERMMQSNNPHARRFQQVMNALHPDYAQRVQEEARRQAGREATNVLTANYESNTGRPNVPMNVSDEDYANAVNTIVGRVGEENRSRIESAMQGFRANGTVSQSQADQLAQYLGEDNPVVREARRVFEARRTAAERERARIEANRPHLNPIVPAQDVQNADKNLAESNGITYKGAGTPLKTESGNRRFHSGSSNCWHNANSIMGQMRGLDMFPKSHGNDLMSFGNTKNAMSKVYERVDKTRNSADTVRWLNNTHFENGDAISAWNGYHNVVFAYNNGQWYKYDGYYRNFGEPVSVAYMASQMSHTTKDGVNLDGSYGYYNGRSDNGRYKNLILGMAKREIRKDRNDMSYNPTDAEIADKAKDVLARSQGSYLVRINQPLIKEMLVSNNPG